MASQPAEQKNATEHLVCSVCHKGFVADPNDNQIKYKMVNGTNLHFECFSCSSCGNLISGKYNTKDDGSWLCVNCIGTVYGQNTKIFNAGADNAFSCTVCKLDCTKKYMEDAAGKKYHDSCFRCMQCGKLFISDNGQSEQYCNIGGNNYCMTCVSQSVYIRIESIHIMSDSDSKPERHNARWSENQKRKVIQLRRSGKKYADIAQEMGRTRNSVKSMCERLERNQKKRSRKSRKGEALEDDDDFVDDDEDEDDDLIDTGDDTDEGEEAHKHVAAPTRPPPSQAQQQQPPLPPLQPDGYTAEYNVMPFNMAYPPHHSSSSSSSSSAPAATHAHTHAHAPTTSTHHTSASILYPHHHQQQQHVSFIAPQASTLSFQAQPQSHHSHSDNPTEMTESHLHAQSQYAYDNSHVLEHQSSSATTTASSSSTADKQHSGMGAIPWPPKPPPPAAASTSIDDGKEVEQSETQSTQPTSTITSTTQDTMDTDRQEEQELIADMTETQEKENNNSDCTASNASASAPHTQESHQTENIAATETEPVTASTAPAVNDSDVASTHTAEQTETNSTTPADHKTSPNSHDTDCVILSHSQPQTPPPKPKQSQGDAGSYTEYQKLVSKYGHRTAYSVDERVLYFVPRLAKRKRYKDRMGRIQRKVDQDQYEVVDEQNGLLELVPWSLVLNYCDADADNVLMRKRSVQQRDEPLEHQQPQQQQPSVKKQKRCEPDTTPTVAAVSQPHKDCSFVPMHSLATTEEKEQEFERRMKHDHSHNHNQQEQEQQRSLLCRQYSVPLHRSYYDENPVPSSHRKSRASSPHPLHDPHLSPHQHPHHRRFVHSRSAYPESASSNRYHEERGRSEHEYDAQHPHPQTAPRVSKHAQRSFSVFPHQRRSSYHAHGYAADAEPRTPPPPPLPPLQRDPDHATLPTQPVVIDIRSAREHEHEHAHEQEDGRRHVDIKMELRKHEQQHTARRSPNHNRQHHHHQIMPSPIYDHRSRDDADRRSGYRAMPRSRSRSPSHIRPSNLIHRDLVQRSLAAANDHGSTHSKYRYSSRPRSPPLPLYAPRPRSYYDRASQLVSPPTSSHYSRRHVYARSSKLSPHLSQATASTLTSSTTTTDEAKLRAAAVAAAARSRSRERLTREHYYHAHDERYRVDEYARTRARDRYDYRHHYHDRRRHHSDDFYEYRRHNAAAAAYLEDDYSRREPGHNCDNLSQQLLMQSWLQVTSRMRGGSKLGQREIEYLCRTDVWPDQIKQYMDSDKKMEERYDLVSQYVDPTGGQHLSRSQVYSIIGAVITMKF